MSESLSLRQRQARARLRLRNSESEKPEQEKSTFVRDLLRAAGQGLSFGSGDEIEAFVRSKLGNESYAANRDQIRSEIKQFQKESPIISTGAEILGSLPTAVLGGAGLARAGITGAGKIAAIEGGLYGFGSGEGGVADRTQDAATGAVLGGSLGRVADAALPRATEAAKAMLKSGARLTPGQTVGGALKKAEEAAVSVPVVGNIIESAQDLAVKDFNRGAMNRALATIGKTVPKALEGNDAFEFARNQIDNAYAAIIPKLKIKDVTDFQSSVVQIIEDNADLPDSMIKQLVSKIDKSIGKRIKKGSIAGSALKEIDSKLGQEAVDFLRSQDPNQRQLGRALFKAQEALRKSLSAANPKVAKQYGKVRMAFANMIPIQNAVVRASLKEGVFTPSQLNTAIRSTDKSPGKIRVARGNAPLQELTQQAQQTVGRELGNSGTVDRGLMALMAKNPAAAITLGIPAAAVTGLLYSNPIGRGVGRNVVQAPSFITRSVAPATGAISADELNERLRLLQQRIR